MSSSTVQTQSQKVFPKTIDRQLFTIATALGLSAVHTSACVRHILCGTDNVSRWVLGVTRAFTYVWLVLQDLIFLQPLLATRGFCFFFYFISDVFF